MMIPKPLPKFGAKIQVESPLTDWQLPRQSVNVTRASSTWTRQSCGCGPPPHRPPADRGQLFPRAPPPPPLLLPSHLQFIFSLALTSRDSLSPRALFFLFESLRLIEYTVYTLNHPTILLFQIPLLILTLETQGETNPKVPATFSLFIFHLSFLLLSFLFLPSLAPHLAQKYFPLYKH